jgi:lipoic acid synthetase
MFYMRLPPWLRTNAHRGLRNTKSLLRGHRLSTVCEEARCPNKGHCFSKPTATFLILGDICTRNCAFCSIDTGRPRTPDHEEPGRIASAALAMGLKYVVVTSVTRDDLEDGGAEQFSRTIRTVRERLPEAKIEVLTPDFKGSTHSVRRVVDASPDVFNHNLETVPRLYNAVRTQADYERSLSVLKTASEMSNTVMTKSGLMAGLGEHFDEVLRVMEDIRKADCTMLTIGQYLRPGKQNLPVKEYVHPDIFEKYREEALNMGFKFVASAPLVRSSMNAEELFLHSN